MAIVTGASSGIGLGFTRALLEHGYRVVANSRNIIDTKATTIDDPTTDPRWGKVGKQSLFSGVIRSDTDINTQSGDD